MNSGALKNPAASMPLLNRVDYGVEHGGLSLVLLHGWGGDSSTFSGLIERLSQHRHIITIDLPGFGGSEAWADFTSSDECRFQLLDAISQQLPERFNLLGWSLGGMLAVQMAHQLPNRVAHLITLASNAVFTESGEWPAAMPHHRYEEFCAYFDSAALPCLTQFCALQAQGDKDQRNLLKALRQRLPKEMTADAQANWAAVLRLLGALDNRETLRHLELPVMHLLGAQDQLVPEAAATMLTQLNPTHHIEVLPGTAHPIHLAAEVEVCAYIEQFLDKEGYQLAKRKVAESFSKAAKTYDGVAHLQRTVGDKLLARLSSQKLLGGEVQRVLDVGCGTGYLISHLTRLLPDSHIIGFDIASGMLDFARGQQADISAWLCGDAELLPMANASVDLVVSNLAYQWCQHPLRWGAELHRVLSDNGMVLLSTLGPETLRELRAAWSSVDGYIHVNEFLPMAALNCSLQQCGLHCDLVVENETLTYSTINELMRELKELGAHNVNAGQSNSLTGRQRIKQLKQAYEQFRNSDGLLPATYEVAYLVIRKSVH